MPIMKITRQQENNRLPWKNCCKHVKGPHRRLLKDKETEKNIISPCTLHA